MKKTIRYGVYETNSSSTHSLTLMNKTDYDKWKDTGMLMRKHWRTGEVEFKTKEEILNEYKKGNPDVEFTDDVLFDWLRDDDWFTYEGYWDRYMECYEGFEETHTTPSGDEVVAFGYYGNDY